MKPHRTLPLVIIVALTLGVLSGCSTQDSRVEVGQPIPPFELTSLGGDSVKSQSYEGKPVLLNFWATWCGPCVKEIPALKEIAKSGEAQVVTIALDVEGEDVVRPFVERYDIEYTVLLGDMALFERFGGRAIPYTLLLSPSLEVVRIYTGLVSVRRLERDLQRAKAA